MAIFFYVVGDTSYSPSITLQDNGVAIPLTDAASVKLLIKNARTGTTVNTGHQTVTVTDADAGVIRYDPQSTDFQTEDRYLAQAEITYSNGKIRTLYEQATFIVRAK